MQIREASLDDIAQLTPLLAQLGYEMDFTTMSARIKAFQKNQQQLLVLEENKQLLGVIAFGCYELFRLAGCCCHIDALIIHHEHRNRGLGKKLIAVAEQYATEQGAHAIELISANHRKATGTHAFYDALGYKNHVSLDCAYFSKENLASPRKT